MGIAMADAGNTITAWAVFSALGGSVIGSIVGGGISYWLQNKNLAAVTAQRAEDRFEARKSLAYSLFIKMGKLFSNVKPSQWGELRSCGGYDDGPLIYYFNRR
jgi:membrane protein YqaA with SNARE-associated domain